MAVTICVVAIDEVVDVEGWTAVGVAGAVGLYVVVAANVKNIDQGVNCDAVVCGR